MAVIVDVFKGRKFVGTYEVTSDSVRIVKGKSSTSQEFCFFLLNSMTKGSSSFSGMVATVRSNRVTSL